MLLMLFDLIAVLVNNSEQIHSLKYEHFYMVTLGRLISCIKVLHL